MTDSISHSSNVYLTKKSIFHYAILAFPLAFAGLPLYIHAPDFYTTQYGVSLAALGSILLAIRMFDAIQDPIIGMLSDRYAHRRKGIIVLGIVLLGVSFYLLFHPIREYALLWFVVNMLVATTAFSLLSINLHALGGTWSDDVHERTRITGTREAIGLVGLLLAVLLPSVLQQSYSPQESFHYVSLVLLVILLLAGSIFYRWLRNHKEQQRKEEESMLPSFSKVYKKLFTIYGISMLSSAIPAVLVLFFIRDRMGVEALTGLFLTLYFLSGVLAMPLWRKISENKGKYQAWFMSMMLAIITFIWAYFIGEGDLWLYGIVCVASGVALGAELALPPSILADVLDEKKSQASASTHFALLTFLSKAALGIASAMVFGLLALAQFQPDAPNNEYALEMLSICYALLPCLIKCIAALILYNWIKSIKKGQAYETPNGTYYRDTYGT